MPVPYPCTAALPAVWCRTMVTGHARHLRGAAHSSLTRIAVPLTTPQRRCATSAPSSDDADRVQLGDTFTSGET
eukprot:5255718-Prymnesium_polylepis.1